MQQQKYSSTKGSRYIFVLQVTWQQIHLCTSSCLAADRVFFDSYGRPIAKRQTCIDNWSKVIREKAGIPKSFHLLHGLRHHFGSVHAANGTPMPVLQKLMHHSEIKTTMIYIEINQNELEEAAQKTVELLDFRLEK
jgi:site-specific recombinase XerD